MGGNFKAFTRIELQRPILPSSFRFDKPDMYNESGKGGLLNKLVVGIALREMNTAFRDQIFIAGQACRIMVGINVKAEKISELTINRLSVYLRCLKELWEEGARTISSQGLADRF